MDERKRLHALCVEAVGGPRAGDRRHEHGQHSADDRADRACEAVGCDGAMVMPPWFVRLPGEDIVAHYRAVSDAVKLP
jgi:4-hydroxy-tetrahydrodipicolinate synthase